MLIVDYLKAKNIRIPILLIMLAAYFMVAQNALLNKHIHVLPNGVIIEHAHPMCNSDEAPTKDNHNHTKTEIIFYGTFSNLEAVLITAAMVFAFLSLPKIEHHSIYKPISVSIDFYSRLSNRAPPVLA